MAILRMSVSESLRQGKIVRIASAIALLLPLRNVAILGHGRLGHLDLQNLCGQHLHALLPLWQTVPPCRTLAPIPKNLRTIDLNLPDGTLHVTSPLVPPLSRYGTP